MSLTSSFGVFEPIALTVAFQVATVYQAIEGRAGQPFRAPYLSPLLEGQVRGDDQAGPLVGHADLLLHARLPDLYARIFTAPTDGHQRG